MFALACCTVRNQDVVNMLPVSATLCTCEQVERSPDNVRYMEPSSSDMWLSQLHSRMLRLRSMFIIAILDGTRLAVYCLRKCGAG